MKEPFWLNRKECLAIHEKMLAQYGGAAEVRDTGLLESALGKPRNQFAYGSPTLQQLAASYAASIVKNHPFVDGNKCTGFMVAAVFLEVNGLVLTASEESVVEQTIRLASGGITEREYAVWLDTNSSNG